MKDYDTVTLTPTPCFHEGKLVHVRLLRLGFWSIVIHLSVPLTVIPGALLGVFLSGFRVVVGSCDKLYAC